MATDRMKHRMHVSKNAGKDVDEIGSRSNEVTGELIKNKGEETSENKRNVSVSSLADIDDVERTLPSTNLHDFALRDPTVENPETNLAAAQQNVPVSCSTDEDDFERTLATTSLQEFVMEATNVENPGEQLTALLQCSKLSSSDMIDRNVNNIVSGIIELLSTCEKPRDFPTSSSTDKDDVDKTLASIDLHKLVMDAANFENPEAQFAAVQECIKLSSKGQKNNTIIFNLVKFGIVPILMQCMKRKDNFVLQFEAISCITNILYHCRGGL